MNRPERQEWISTPQEPIWEFRAFTESEVLSLKSKEILLKNLKKEKINRVSWVDSFFSK